MIAAVCWVPRGAAKPVPQPIEPPSAEEIRELILGHDLEVVEEEEQEEEEHDEDGHRTAAKSDLASIGDESMVAEEQNAVSTALAAARALGGKAQADARLDGLAAGLAELDMDNYDNEDENVELFGSGGLGGAYYGSNDLDPYLTNKDSEDEEDIEDMTIHPTDLVLLTARNEDDVSHLEMWVYEDKSEDGIENVYVHHDIMLPAFPLTVAWLDCNPNGGEKGNYVAVGTMQPNIEIWDLDILDAVEPVAVLGGYKEPSTKKIKGKKKKSKAPKLREGSHSDAVLGLAWNNEYRNVLASASADTSIKIWDIVTQKCEHTITCHSDKVQAVAWNMHEHTVLLSGSFDHSVVLMDMRDPTNQVARWNVSADVECIAWDPHTSHSFVVSLEDGTVCGYDVRFVAQTSASSAPGKNKPVFMIHAHDKAVCTVSYNTTVPHMLATGSTDKMVKLWDIKDNKPTCVCSKNPKVGAVFTSAFCKDSPFLLAIGGSKGNLSVWDTLSEGEVAKRFGMYASRKPPPRSEDS